jgi:hypothetical protein
MTDGTHAMDGSDSWCRYAISGFDVVEEVIDEIIMRRCFDECLVVKSSRR